MVARLYFLLFPTREDVGDAVILFDIENAEFADELFASAHEQFAVFTGTLAFPDVQHHKIKLCIHGSDLALKGSGKGDLHGGTGVTGQFNPLLLDLGEQDAILGKKLGALVADISVCVQFFFNLILSTIGELELSPRLTECVCLNPVGLELFRGGFVQFGTLSLLYKGLLRIAKAGHSGFGFVLGFGHLFLRLFLRFFGIGQITTSAGELGFGCIEISGNSVHLSLNITESDECTPTQGQNCYK